MIAISIITMNTGGTNKIVRAEFDMKKNNMICSFMSQQFQNISCSITYWLCADPQVKYNAVEAWNADATDNQIVISLASNLDGNYCFIIDASYDNKSVGIEGTFTIEIREHYDFM